MTIRKRVVCRILLLSAALASGAAVYAQEVDPPVERTPIRRGAAASTLGTVPGPDPISERVLTSLDYQEMRLRRNRDFKAVRVTGEKSTDLEDLGLPEKAAQEISKSRSCLRENKPAKAIEHLKKAAALAPQYSKIYNNMGLIYREMGQLQEAEASFHRAVEINARNSIAQRNLGYLFIATNRPEKAVEPLSLAAQLEPADASAKAFLGDAMFRIGRMNEAEISLKNALAINPDCYPAAYRLGCLYAQQRKIPEAITLLERVLKLDHPGLETASVQHLLTKLREIIR